MIKKITIDNFRTHKHTELEFADGINIIVGFPDSGKTNIIRSILWALTNRPLGFRFHSDTSQDPDTKVKIQFKEKSWIELHKNKKTALYQTSIDQESLKAIGSDVPDSVLTLANMSELNIQKQLDQHFLICSTPAEVAKVFNRITRLEKIDKTVSLLTTDINSCNKEIKRVDEEIIAVQAKLDEIGDLSDMESASQYIVDLQEQRDDLIQRQENLQGKVNALESASTEMGKYAKAEKATKDFIFLEDLQNNIRILEEESEETENIIQSLESAFQKYQVLEKNIRVINTDYEALKAQQELINQDQDTFQELQDIVNDIEKSQSAVITVGDRVKASLREYKDYLKTIKICPFCEKCKTPLEQHDFNLFLKEFEI